MAPRPPASSDNPNTPICSVGRDRRTYRSPISSLSKLPQLQLSCNHQSTTTQTISLSLKPLPPTPHNATTDRHTSSKLYRQCAAVPSALPPPAASLPRFEIVDVTSSPHTQSSNNLHSPKPNQPTHSSQPHAAILPLHSPLPHSNCEAASVEM